MRRVVVLCTGLLAGCSDYSLGAGKDEPGGAGDTARPGGVTGTLADTALPAGEDCNGEDDDGDGLVDEGWPDLDGDGVADCVDEDCDVALVDPEAVATSEACVPPDVSVSDPWDLVVEWSWTGPSSDPTLDDVAVAPVVGELDDDDGDGDVDGDDVPDVVVVATRDWDFSSGTLVVIDGATGVEKWTDARWSVSTAPALADVDGDGVSEILVSTVDGLLVALDASGTLLWASVERATYSSAPGPLVADLDGDGAPEVIYDDLVVDGATGALRVRLPVRGAASAREPAIGDIDLDGRQEIVLGGQVFDADGTPLWEVTNFPSVDGPVNYAAIFDADGDPEGEVVVLADLKLGIYDADGTELALADTGEASPSAPCVADFDGDGAAEIAVPTSRDLRVYEVDGTVLWSVETDDMSRMAVCSGFDADGDGAWEVYYADQGAFTIFDGATGAPLFVDPDHASWTAAEYPVIADVDGDGSAEVLVVGSDWFWDGRLGVVAWGHADGAWPAAGPAWPVYDFAVTNVLADGTVPAWPVPWWQVDNVYRARPSVDHAVVNVEAEVLEVCASGCVDASAVQVAVRVRNTGLVDLPAGLPVALYAESAGARTLLATTTVPDPIPAGTTSAGIAFDLTLAEARVEALVVVADDDGTGAGRYGECDESDNEDAWLVDFGCR